MHVCPQAIHMLVTAATDLQKDIVESGRVRLGTKREKESNLQQEFCRNCSVICVLQGSGSMKDFYAKNSCWTEGLISASKAVGWGATQMV